MLTVYLRRERYFENSKQKKSGKRLSARRWNVEEGTGWMHLRKDRLQGVCLLNLCEVLNNDFGGDCLRYNIC